MASTFSYRALLLDYIRRYGVSGTLGRLSIGFWEFVRDSFPSRRRLRFGDLDFDFEQHADTTWSNVSMGTRFREIFAGRGYQATDPVIFGEMMERVEADLREFVFIDLGCGKGRALLLARNFGFRRIVGVELLPELLDAARRNILRLPEQEQARFEIREGDARAFVFPHEPAFVYLFDPFPPEVLAEVLCNLAGSVREYPRPLLIGYQNPVSEDAFKSVPEFKKIAGTVQWALYRWVS